MWSSKLLDDDQKLSACVSVSHQFFFLPQLPPVQHLSLFFLVPPPHSFSVTLYQNMARIHEQRRHNHLARQAKIEDLFGPDGDDDKTATKAKVTTTAAVVPPAVPTSEQTAVSARSFILTSSSSNHAR